MKTCVIFNPKAGSAKRNQALRESLEAMQIYDLRVTEYPGHAGEIATEVASEGCAEFVIAGGDGTVNEALNGLGENLGTVTLAILPLGTGNDSARTLGMPNDPHEALELLRGGLPSRTVDLVQITSGDEQRLLLNHVNAGYSHLVTEDVTPETKQRLGPLAYVKSLAGPLQDMESYETHIEWDDGSIDVVDALNIVVANGRTIAGGFTVAPASSMEDETMRVLILRVGSLAAIAGAAARLLVGQHFDSDLVIARRARALRVESQPPMTFSVDGETFAEGDATIEVCPGALDVLVGPDYVREPLEEELSRPFGGGDDDESS
ncbi:MAG: diacylglycerol/lipid kinase family protein [Myxococcota bacterium]